MLHGVASAAVAAYGALLGLAVVGGELPTSFVKRQAGIAPGRQAGAWRGAAMSLYDQGDFVLAGAIALRPLWRASAREVAGAWLTVSAAHLLVNLAGYAIGARERPI